jgi:hypothetical protein
MASAERVRLHRERARNGLRVVPVLVHEVDTVEMLVRLNYLADPDPTRQELGDALSRYFYELVTRFNAARWPGA